MTPNHYLVLAGILFTIGAFGVLVRRNAIIVFMSVEMMLNAANLAFVTASRIAGTLDGQVAAFGPRDEVLAALQKAQQQAQQQSLQQEIAAKVTQQATGAESSP